LIIASKCYKDSVSSHAVYYQADLKDELFGRPRGGATDLGMKGTERAYRV